MWTVFRLKHWNYYLYWLVLTRNINFIRLIWPFDWRVIILRLGRIIRPNSTGRNSHTSNIINEIFKPNVIGQDLKHALLLLFNGAKRDQLIPIFMQLANIHTELRHQSPRGTPNKHISLTLQYLFMKYSIITTILTFEFI